MTRLRIALLPLIVLIIAVVATDLLKPADGIDGQWIAFYCGLPDQNEHAIYLIRVDMPDGEIRHLVGPTSKRVTSPAWSPDGNWIAYSENDDLYLIHGNGSDRRRLQLGQDVYGNPDWSPDSKSLAFVVNVSRIATTQINGDEIQRLTSSIGIDERPAWSPNGDLIAFAHGQSLYSMQSDGQNRKLILTSNAEMRYVTWSPDGNWLAFFYEGEDNQYTLYKVRPDGTDLEHILDAPFGLKSAPTWSPDGNWIAFSGLGDGDLTAQIYKIRPDGTDLQRVTNLSECNPASLPSWSPLLQSAPK